MFLMVSKISRLSFKGLTLRNLVLLGGCGGTAGGGGGPAGGGCGVSEGAGDGGPSWC